MWSRLLSHYIRITGEDGNGYEDVQIAIDREDRERDRVAEEGCERSVREPSHDRLQRTEEDRRLPPSWLCKVRRHQETRNQRTRRHQSIHERTDDVQGQTGP